MHKLLKTSMQGFLRRIGLYHRIKFSVLYDLYWTMADRNMIHKRAAEIHFYLTTLQGCKKGDLFFDIGANRGYKTDIFLRLGAQVVAAEPDSLNQEILRQSFLNYRLARKPVVIVGKAITDKIGSHVMWVEEPGSAKNTLNPKWVETLRTDKSRFGNNVEFVNKVEVETTTLEELVRLHGYPFYIKIDVEGHETSVLKGLRSVVPFVSFEVNLPEFRPEAFRCIEVLEKLSAGGRFNYTADVLHGLALEPWLPQGAFVDTFSKCEESCVEVFWRASGVHTAAMSEKDGVSWAAEPHSR